MAGGASERKVGMLKQEILDRLRKLVDPLRITIGKGFHLKDFDPGETGGLMLDKGELGQHCCRFDLPGRAGRDIGAHCHR